MQSKIKKMATMAMLVALLVVCSQLAVPVGNVPITAQTAAVMLIALLLSPVLVFILAGGIGLPFFANFKGGLGVLLGPTGGYLYGFVAAAALISAIAGRQFSWLRSIAGCTVGLLFVYLFGAVQLKLLLDLESYGAAFALGGIPYILFEPIKIAVAVVAAKMLQSRGLDRF